MGQRDDARRNIEGSRERMSEIAEELSARATPSYVKRRAKQTLVRKGNQWRDQATGSPWTYSALGALLGGLAGRWLIQRREDRRTEERYGSFEPYEPAEEQSKLGGAVEDAKSAIGSAVEGTQETVSTAVHGAKDYAAQKLDRVREGLPVVRDRAESWTRELIAERPVVAALAAVGLGALASLLIPVSDIERKALGPAKGKVSQLAEELQQKVQEKVESGSQSQVGSEQEPVAPEPLIH